MRPTPLLPLPFCLAAASLLLAFPAPSVAQEPAAPPAAPSAPAGNPTQLAGPLRVELLAPAGGVAAGREAEITLRITDSTGGGVPFARLKAEAALASDPGVKADKVRLRSGRVTGDYLLTARFPRPGAYRLTLQVAPPGQGGEPAPAAFDLTVAEAPGGDKKGGDKGAEESAAAAPYELKVELDPRRPLAGNSVEVKVTVRDRATGELVKEFEEVRQRRMHLFLVREDGGELYLEQPVPDERTGEVKFRYSFPTGGEWRVWADVAPKGGGGAYLLPARVRIDGPRPLREQMMPQLAPQVRDNGMTLTMRPTRITAGSTDPVPLRLVDGRGGPVTDLQPFDGALAQLYFVDRDAKVLLMAQPDETDPRNGRSDTLTFPVRFPKGGVYKGWLQVQRGTVRSLMPFIIRVADGK